MNNNEFEDIEQLLKPQCEFKASETLKQEVIEKARQEIKPRRIVMWPWLAAACVAGFMWILFAPPETQKDEALQAQQDKEYYTQMEQMAYARMACEQVSFESLEREMRNKGEQLKAEHRNQLKRIEQNEKDDDMGHNAPDLVRLQKQ